MTNESQIRYLAIKIKKLIPETDYDRLFNHIGRMDYNSYRRWVALSYNDNQTLKSEVQQAI